MHHSSRKTGLPFLVISILALWFATSSSATLELTNQPPVAHAGAHQTVPVQSRVRIDGSASTDIDGDALSYRWLLVDKPAASQARLIPEVSDEPIAEFVADVAGEYVARLIVSDGVLRSEADVTIVSTRNSAPVARAGADQIATPGTHIDLDGSKSSDPDGDHLRYSWSLATPDGSRARLLNPWEPNAAFTIDRAGTYTATLTVNDGEYDSAPDSVTFSTSNLAPLTNIVGPTAAVPGERVILDGTASADVNGDALGFDWSLLRKPAESTATLLDVNQPRATLIPDLPGTYIAQLVVHDGASGSAPGTHRITVRVAANSGETTGAETERTRRRDAESAGNRVNTSDDPTAAAQARSRQPEIRTSLTPLASIQTESSSVWPDATRVDGAVGTVAEYDSRTSGDGSAIYYWPMWTRRYDGIAGWAAPATVPWPHGSIGKRVIRLADMNGSLIALWNYTSGGGYAVRVSHFNPATGWTTPQLLASGSESFGDLALAVGNNGHALALWFKVNGSNLSSTIHASVYNPNQGWSAAAQVGSSNGNVSTFPSIDVTNSGDIYYLWRPNSREMVVERYSQASATWSSPLYAMTLTSSNARLAANDTGAFLAYTDSSDVRVMRYNSATGATSTAGITTTASYPAAISIATNAVGDAIAAWTERANTGNSRLHASRFTTTANSWRPPVILADLPANSYNNREVQSPLSALHDSGKGIVGWREARNSLFSLWSSASPSASGAWSAPLLVAERRYETINSNTQPDFRSPALQFAGGNTLLASWLQSSASSPGLFNLYERRMAWAGSGNPEQPPAPRAYAGELQSVVEDATVSLNGSQSQGAITSYSWTQVEGPLVTLNGSNTATPSFLAALPSADPLTSQSYRLLFQLTVSDAAGNSSSDQVPVEVLSLPTPKLLRATAQDTANLLSWAPNNASSYNIYWSLTPGVTKTNSIKIAAAARPFLHTGLNNGAAYYYAVTASYGSNTLESALSEEVAATPSATPAPQSWGLPTQLATGTTYQTDIAADPAGNATAVWVASSSGVNSVFARRFEPASGWSAPTVISTAAVTTSTNSQQTLRVAMSSDSAMAVWLSTANHAFASRWTPATGWSSPAMISDGTLTVRDIDIASDKAGNALAVWVGGSTPRVYVNRYVAGAGWQTPIALQTTTTSSFLGNLSMEPSGQAIVTWNNQSRLYLARFHPTTGWQPAFSFGFGSSPQVSINASGDAAVLRDYGGMQVSVLESTGAAPGAEQMLLPASTIGLQLRMDDDGHQLANWLDTTNTLPADIVKAAHRPIATQQWAAPQALQTLQQYDAQRPGLAMDAHGNAVAIWIMAGSQRNAYASSYQRDGGWSPESVLDGGAVASSRIALGGFGDGVALLQRTDGSLWAVRYTGPDSSKRPQALATSQVVTEGDTAVLPGDAIAPPGSSIVGYSWQQTGGPAVALSDSQSAQPSFIAPPVTAATTLQFALTVTDSQGRSDSVAVAVLVRDVPPLVLTTNLTEASPGQTVRFTATLSGTPRPSGTVQFFSGTTPLGSATISNGSSSLSITTLALGTHSITATYSGDAIYAPSVSDAVVVTVTDVPIINMSNPSSDATLVAPANLQVRTSATARVGTIARIEVLDNGVVIGSGNFTSASASFNYNFNNMPLGLHEITARAVDARGIERTSAPVRVRVVGPPTVTLGGLSSPTFLVAPGFAYLQAQASSPNGAISKVEFFSATNTLIGTVTAPPYVFAWNDIPAGTYSVTARVTDEYNQTARTTPAIALTVGSAPTVTMTSPSNNALIAGTIVPVLRGALQAPPNSTVTVNGRVATVADNGTYFVNNLPLQPGSNSITLVVTTLEGQSATRTYTLRSQGTAAFHFMASPSSGIAPARSRLSVTASEAAPTIVRIDYSCNNNSTVDATFPTLTPIECVYTQPGVYTARADVIGLNSSGVQTVIFTATQSIEVASLQSLDARLRGVYQNMLNKLRAGNISGAVNAISADTRAQFQQMFNEIPDLPTAIDQIGTIVDATIYENFVEYRIVRPSAEGDEGYRMYFVRCDDGIWRIESM